MFVTDLHATDPPDINYLVKASDVNDIFVVRGAGVVFGYLIGTAKVEEVTSCEAGRIGACRDNQWSINTSTGK